jgi:hypothetical protein
MTKQNLISAGLLAIGLLMATGIADSAWARRDVRQDECPPDIRCPPGEITPDSDRGDDRDTGDDSQDDDSTSDDISEDDVLDTAPE